MQVGLSRGKNKEKNYLFLWPVDPQRIALEIT
jgi:hypothetical protein